MSGVIKPFPPSSALSRARARETATLVQVRALAERGASEAQAMVRQRRLRILSHRRRMLVCAIVSIGIGLGGGLWIAEGRTPPPAVTATPLQFDQVVYQVSMPLVVAQPDAPSESAQGSPNQAIHAGSGRVATTMTGVTSVAQYAGQGKQATAQPKPANIVEPPNNTRSATAIAQSSSTGATPTNVYEAATKQEIAREVASTPVELRVIGIPVDGVLQLDVNGVVRQFKPGQTLPNGETLTEANATSNRFKTNRVPTKAGQN